VNLYKQKILLHK